MKEGWFSPSPKHTVYPLKRGRGQGGQCPRGPQPYFSELYALKPFHRPSLLPIPFSISLCLSPTCQSVCLFDLNVCCNQRELRDHSWQYSEDRMGARNQIRVSCIKNKHPTCTTISLHLIRTGVTCLLFSGGHT